MAAGLGFKTFTTGEVLTAADTNGYLMQGVLVFASAAARDAAITSPQEGQCCYLKDTDAVLTYSGAAWVGFDDSNAIQNSIVDAKGDLVAASGADTPARLAVGANNTILMADSAEATGLKYAGAYTSFTPTVTSGVGTFTTVSATSRYLRIGNLVHWFGRVIISVPGTATGAIILTVPIAKSGANNPVGFGEETNVIGFGVFGSLTTVLTILKLDYTTAITTNAGIDFNITYEVA
jgi:hypothetical protein